MKGPRRHSSFILIGKNQYLVALALVSPTRNSRSRAQTPIYYDRKSTLFESRWLLRPVGHQTCQLRAWKPGFLSQESSAKRPQPGILSQESSARFLSQDSSARSLQTRNPQPGFLSQESSARRPQQRFLSQDSSARNLQPGGLSQDSSASSPQPGFLSQESSASSLQPICLGSALEFFVFVN